MKELISFYEWNTITIIHSLILYTLSLLVIGLSIKLIQMLTK